MVSDIDGDSRPVDMGCSVLVEVAPQGVRLRFLLRVGRRVRTRRADRDDPVEFQHACRNVLGGKLDTCKCVRRNGVLCQGQIRQETGVLGVGRGQDPVLAGEIEQPVAGTAFLAHGGADGGDVIAPALGRPQRKARLDERGQYGNLPYTAEANTKITDRVLLRAGLVSLVLIAAVAYFAVRIALRPVETIRVLTASVTASDPRERVTVPATGHEITALATTINSTLQRLDDAAAQQRRFVADAAHELRSPLTTLLASLEVALAYPERTHWPAAVTTAARQTRRLHALAEDLLLLARLDARTPMARPGTVDLTALALRLTEQYPFTERPLTLTCDSIAPAIAHGNLDEYERLLRNLVDNAARHAAHRIRITIRNQDAWVVLTVHDDGPGVPTEDAERIFERFVRLDDARSRDHGGTGLGLAIARDLAHRHRGTLTLTPRPLGACFELRLPRAPTPAEE